MDKKEYRKKMIAPIIIGVIVVIYLLFYFNVTIFMPITTGKKILFLIVPLASIGVMLHVLWERVKEIRSGEEDDLSEY